MNSPWLLLTRLSIMLLALGWPTNVCATDVTPRQEWNDLPGHLRSSDQVIAELSSGEEAAGTFVAVDASALTLWINGTAKRILKEDIRTLVRIRASHRRGTVLVGAIAGAAVGLLMVADQEDYNARGRLLFASLGGGVGAAIGAAFRKQTTREVVYRLNPELRGASLYSLVLPPCRRFRELTLSIPGENSSDSARPLAFITRGPMASLIETCGRSGRLR